MGDKTGISWTMGQDGSPGSTWNWLRGCTEFGDDCANCYAKRIGARFSGEGQAYHGFAIMKHTAGGRSLPQWTGKVNIVADHLLDPVRWKEPRKIFCVSVSDPFHEELSNYEVAVGYGVMAIAGRHTYQNLTKRSKRRKEWFAWVEREAKVIDQSPAMFCYLAMRTWAETHHARGAKSLRNVDVSIIAGLPWPLPWVWEGVSAGHQKAADDRIPYLLETPAAVRFVSLEPLLGPINLTLHGGRIKDWDEDWHYDTLRGQEWGGRWRDDEPPESTSPRLDWVICGVESGPGARRCDVEWLRSLRDQCSASGVPYFLKQANEIDGPRGTISPIRGGGGAKYKGKLLIELPYLDGVQHASFPEVRS